MDSNRKSQIVDLATVLVWVMLLHGALMIAVGSALVLDAFDFSFHDRGGLRSLMQLFGFPLGFAGALNILAAVLWLRRSTYRWYFWVYLAVIVNLLLCVVALMGYGRFISIRRDFESVWWSWYMAVHLLHSVGVLLRHLSAAATRNLPPERKRNGD